MKVVEGLARAKGLLPSQRGLGLEELPSQVRAKIRQVFGRDMGPVEVVEHILEQVRTRGDEAVQELSLKLDGVETAVSEVSKKQVQAAYDRVPSKLVGALKLAAKRIHAFHETSMPRGWVDPEKGYGQMIVPMERAGVYVPGGTAAYPSTVLMTAIPARVSGVREIVVATPARGSDGPSPAVLVACDIAGADRVFQIGGAQAIAAMAYGTRTVPKVDIVCGPGNIFVTLAKKLLYGHVGIDGIYGPTETVVIADEMADPALCAADLLAQAEHDLLATPVFITTSRELAKAVEREIGVQLETLERKQIAEVSLRERGCIVVVGGLEEAIELANHFAPEHLCLMVADPWSLLGKVKNAGGVFMGEFSPEVMGDYTAGPSHTMPTSGTARFSSSLGVHSFLKIVPIVALGRESFAAQAEAVSTIGRAEGFTAHARAAELRTERLTGQVDRSDGT